jgi:hypothetical protein
MALDPLRESSDSKSANGAKTRSVKTSRWRYAVLTFVGVGSISAAYDALHRLHALGQKTSDILWESFGFAMVFTLFTTVAGILVEREDARAGPTIVDSPTKKREIE